MPFSMSSYSVSQLGHACHEMAPVLLTKAIAALHSTPVEQHTAFLKGLYLYVVYPSGTLPCLTACNGLPSRTGPS